MYRSPRHRRSRPLLTVLALALVTGACSSDGDSGADLAAGQQAPEGAEATGDAESSFPVTVTDGIGRSVTLDAPPTDVVALEWTYAEDLLVLGVEPAGVADIEGYNAYVTEPQVPETVTDVGTRQEPSLESIAALDPDLIIGVAFRHEATLDQLEAIAPTLLFNPYPDDLTGQLEEMRSTFETIAEATGRADEATAALDELDSAVAAAADAFAGAGLEGTEVAVGQGFTQEGAGVVRMSTDNALVVELLAEAGLANGWPGEPEPFGFNTVDLEGLTELGDVRFLAIASAEDNPFTTLFDGNPIWEGLPFVEAGHVVALPPDTWPFGGPSSSEIFLDRVVAALTT